MKIQDALIIIDHYKNEQSALQGLMQVKKAKRLAYTKIDPGNDEFVAVECNGQQYMIRVDVDGDSAHTVQPLGATTNGEEDATKEQDFKRGDQIAYIPSHANGLIDHPDVELGFVVSVQGDTIFCRYWSKIQKHELRTKANSEGTPRSTIVPHVHTDQWCVEQALVTIW